MTTPGAATASAPPLPKDPQARVRQAEEQIRLALAERGATRLDALRRALRLNPYALKARYLLGASLLQAGEIAQARQILDAVTQVAPDYAPIKFYRFIATIRKPKKGELAKADAVLKELERDVSPNLALVLCRLELSLRRKKPSVPITDWLGWLKQIPITRKNVPLIADKCAKFFLERKQVADGNQVLSWLKDSWFIKFPRAPLLTVLSYLHHIRYWPQDRWVAELQEQVFDETTGDLVCLFILERTKKNEQGKSVPEDKWLEEMRALVAQLPGVSSLAYNYLSLLNTVAKKRLLMDGDVEGAAQLWRESSGLDPFNTLIQFNLALAEAKQGRTKEYYIHWQQALRLAYWRWELGDDQQDWELCVARARATANKLHEEITSEQDKRDIPPAEILAWLKYLDVYAIARQLTFDLPRHLLGVRADAPAAEARRVAKGWQATLDGWERRNHLKPPFKFGVHLPSELVVVARARIQKATKSRRKSVSDSELDAFQEYCKHRAEHARDIFFMSAHLSGQNRFDEAQALLDRLVAMPLTTLKPYLEEIKINAAEGEVPFSDLINEKELAQRTIGYACTYAEFLAKEGDDQELGRRIEEIGNLPWAQLDDPDESRRKIRERIAFAVLDPAAFDAINDNHWTDALPAIEAALHRLPDQLDLLWLAAFALFRSAQDECGEDPDKVRWKEVQATLKKASDYCKRAKKAAPPDEFEVRVGNLPDAVENDLKMATEMSSPRGKALRRARSLMDQEEWNQAYKVLSKVPSKDRNAEIEFYLGLCIYREIEVSLVSGKKRPPLNTIQSRLKKAASHLRSARKKATEDNLKEVIENLSEAVNGMLEQVEYALLKESAESLMEKGQWDKVYNKLSKVSKPDAGLLFYMALCRFRGVMQEFKQASPYSRPSIPRAIKRLRQALDHTRDAKRICDDDNLKKTLDDLEDAVRSNLNVLKTM